MKERKDSRNKLTKMRERERERERGKKRKQEENRKVRGPSSLNDVTEMTGRERFNHVAFTTTRNSSSSGSNL